MNLERVTFSFFIILTLSLNYAFVAGGLEAPAHHNVWIVAESGGEGGSGPKEIADIVSIATGALVANIVATVILVGDTLLSRR